MAAVVKRVRSLGVVAAQSVARTAAPALTSAALADFDGGRTAYGTPRPVGANGPVSLVRTGKTRSTIRFTAQGTALRIVLGTRYAKYLIGRYNMLPSGGRKAIPRAWRTSIDGIVARVTDAAWKAGA